MTEIPKAFADMLAAWNETDPEKIRGHIDRALSESVVFADPTTLVNGRDEFEQMIREFRKNHPAGRCVPTSGIDGHHNRYRYEWTVYSGDAVAATGFDVVSIDASGLVERVDGFFGPFPPIKS